MDFPEIVTDKKNALTEQLSAQYALNNLTMDEYERLIEYAQKIETPRELAILERIIVGAETYRAASQEEEYARYDSPGKKDYTIMSSRESTGSALNVRDTQIVCIMGTHTITLTEADLLRGISSLNLKTIMGEIVIYVPSRVRIVNKIIPIMGEVKIGKNLRDNPSGLQLVLLGTAIMGSVTVKSRGDSFLDAIKSALE